jgi:hypothetical protein
MVMGFILVKSKRLDAKDSIVLSRLSLYLIMPCVIIGAFQIEFNEQVRSGMMFAFAAALLFQIVPIVIGRGSRKLCHWNEVEEASIIYSNSGNLVIPIVTSVLGEEWVIYASAFVAIQLFFLWSHGVSMFEDGRKIDFKKMLLNINMISVLVGVVLLLTGIRLPDVVNEACDSVGAMLGPVAMLITGMLAAEMDVKRIIANTRIYLVLFLRLLLCPMVILLLIALTHAKAWNTQGEYLLLIAFLASATPAASTITQFAQVYDKDAEYAGAINIITTIGCIVTMPVLVWIYMKL